MTNFKLPLLLKILFIEFLLTVWLFIDRPYCADTCHRYSFVNPLGLYPAGNYICTKECHLNTPHAFFYLSCYVFVITLVIFLVSIVVKKIRKK